jgi:hypothetical protein
MPSVLCGSICDVCATSAAASAPARARRRPLRSSLAECLCSKWECVWMMGRRAPRAFIEFARRMMVALYGWRRRKRSLRPSDTMVLWICIAAVLSTAWTTSRCGGIIWYAWMSPSSSTLSDDASNVLTYIRPCVEKDVVAVEMCTPNVDEHSGVPWSRTEPSDAVYIGSCCVSSSSRMCGGSVGGGGGFWQ